MKKISILLPAYKSENLIKHVFVPSVKRNSSTDIQIVIYDNGGNGKLEERIFARNEKTFNVFDILKIGDGTNIGLNAALNECARAATGDYFYLPHTDMYLMPGWDIALLESCKNLPPASYLLCSRSVEPGFSHIPSQIRKDFGDEWNNFKEIELLKQFDSYVNKSIIINARMPFWMHRQLWEKLGGVDPKYFSFCTDDDLIQDCYDKGVRRFWMVYGSLVYHLQGKSNNQQKIDKDASWPYEYFVDKWKTKYPNIQHPGQYHPKLIPFETKVK